MALENKNLTAVLYSIEGVGAVFVVIFLAAYLGGLPTTNVLQDQPAFRIPLTVLGALTLILIFVAVTILAVPHMKRPMRYEVLRPKRNRCFVFFVPYNMLVPS